MSGNPFELRGPDFLIFYAIVLAGLSLAIALVRKKMRASPTNWLASASKVALDPYETAFLAGGGQRAMILSIASLAERNAIEISPTSRAIRATGKGSADHAVERAMLSVVTTETTLSKLGEQMRPKFDSMRTTLEKQGLVMSSDARNLSNFLTVLLILGALGVGITKMIIGASRHKPIGFLVVMCFAYLLITVIIVVRKRPFRTDAGDKMLAKLRAESSEQVEPANTISASFPMTFVALYGMDVLAGYWFYDEMKRVMVAPASGGGGSGCSSSGCGGGGCGGGGCGGCGGGD